MRKCFYAFICIVLSAAMVLSMTSCSLRISAESLSDGYVRKADAGGEVTEEFRTAMADFSLTLFKGLVTDDDKNDLISPLSAVICLAMIANGADGNTKTQMETAFGMDTDTLNECLYAYTSSLYTADDCKFNLADSIWFRDDGSLHINEAFLQTNADWYNSQVYAAPFDMTTVSDINEWCKSHTDGMIDKILDNIDGNAVMYLINALTFDAKWAEKYEDSDISERVFTNHDGTKKKVKMLTSDENTFISADGVKGFAKDYSGGKYSIVALLPDEGKDIYEYIATLDGTAWTSLWNSRRSENVSVKMPEFTYSSHMKLKEVLMTMGMTDMFSASADFSKMGRSDIGSIYCSTVEQKVFIQVDRNGTKAAAISWGGMENSFAPLLNEIILDRPFVYAIVDNNTGLPLFIGAVSTL